MWWIILSDLYNVINYSLFEEGYIGIGVSVGDDAEVICYDDSGNVMPNGYWLLDKNGNAISERYDRIYIGEDECAIRAVSPNDTIVFSIGETTTKKTVSEILIK